MTSYLTCARVALLTPVAVVWLGESVAARTAAPKTLGDGCRGKKEVTVNGISTDDSLSIQL